jgi:hypothetical protein
MVLVANQEMDMRGTEGVSIHHLQKMPSRTIIRDLRYISDGLARHIVEIHSLGME